MSDHAGFRTGDPRSERYRVYDFMVYLQILEYNWSTLVSISTLRAKVKFVRNRQANKPMEMT